MQIEIYFINNSMKKSYIANQDNFEFLKYLPEMFERN